MSYLNLPLLFWLQRRSKRINLEAKNDIFIIVGLMVAMAFSIGLFILLSNLNILNAKIIHPLMFTLLIYLLVFLTSLLIS